MIDKFVPDVAAALAGIADGAVILLPGFGNGMPETLVKGLIAQGARWRTPAAGTVVPQPTSSHPADAAN
jgi:acyl CoA:acetate/3-ketoacid CoA transferase alpha subunit